MPERTEYPAGMPARPPREYVNESPMHGPSHIVAVWSIEVFVKETRISIFSLGRKGPKGKFFEKLVSRMRSA